VRLPNGFLLIRFIAPAKKNHKFHPMLAAVNTVPWSNVDYQFNNPASDRPMIAQISICNPIHSIQDIELRHTVSQGVKPFLVRDLPGGRLVVEDSLGHA